MCKNPFEEIPMDKETSFETQMAVDVESELASHCLLQIGSF
jgi:hypothetical protein